MFQSYEDQLAYLAFADEMLAMNAAFRSAEDSELDSWLDELEVNYVNYELQEIAHEFREDEIFYVWEDMMLERFICSDFEASHVLDF